MLEQIFKWLFTALLVVIGTIAMMIVAYKLIKRSIRKKRTAKWRREREVEAAAEEREWNSALVKAAAYLDGLPIRHDEAALVAKWHALNASFVYRKSTYHDYKVGTGAEVLAKLTKEMRDCWYSHKKKDREVQGWFAIGKMISAGKDSCTYRFGANEDGLIVCRFGDDRYAIVKTHRDEVFAR